MEGPTSSDQPGFTTTLGNQPNLLGASVSQQTSTSAAPFVNTDRDDQDDRGLRSITDDRGLVNEPRGPNPSVQSSTTQVANKVSADGGLHFMAGGPPEELRSRKNMTVVRKKAMRSYLSNNNREGKEKKSTNEQQRRINATPTDLKSRAASQAAKLSREAMAESRYLEYKKVQSAFMPPANQVRGTQETSLDSHADMLKKQSLRSTSDSEPAQDGKTHGEGNVQAPSYESYHRVPVQGTQDYSDGRYEDKPSCLLTALSTKDLADAFLEDEELNRLYHAAADNPDIGIVPLQVKLVQLFRAFEVGITMNQYGPNKLAKQLMSNPVQPETLADMILNNLTDRPISLPRTAIVVTALSVTQFKEELSMTRAFSGFRRALRKFVAQASSVVSPDMDDKTKIESMEKHDKEVLRGSSRALSRAVGNDARVTKKGAADGFVERHLKKCILEGDLVSLGTLSHPLSDLSPEVGTGPGHRSINPDNQQTGRLALGSAEDIHTSHAVEEIVEVLAEKQPVERDASQRSLPLSKNFAARLLVSCGLLEPPLLSGMVRLHWDCRCGDTFFSDVYEYREGGVSRLAKRMHRSTGTEVTFTSYNEGSSHQNHTFRSPLWVQSATRRLSTTISQIFDDGKSLPQHHTRIVSKASATPTQTAPTFGRTMYLMACIHRTEHHINVVQDVLENISTDRQLFSFLKTQLKQHAGRLRSLLSTRRVRKIFLVKFKLRKGSVAEVRHHRYGCQPQTCECIPPQSRVIKPPMGSGEYDCNPSGPSDTWPPICPEFMMHMLYSPGCIAEGDSSILEQLPKKMDSKLEETKGPPPEGWGLYFQEDLDLSAILGVVFIVLFLASLLFLILWTMLKDDIQGASGVSAYIVASASMLGIWIATKCRTWA